MLSERDLRSFKRDGYVILRGGFSAEEATRLRTHYMDLRAAGSYPDDLLDIARGDRPEDDPLRRYPRMANMHRWDQASLEWLLDARLVDAVAGLLGSDPLAVQSMVYFKPPGSRGQALHQDQFFLRARPGTCMAAWLALDDSVEENGCMHVVPGSQEWPMLCPSEADPEESFTAESLALPAGHEPVALPMRAGDVLFFNGSLVHGSYRNTTTDRFRRSLIGHYIDARALAIASWNQPVLRRDGVELYLEADTDGGPCGTWVERGGEAHLEAFAGIVPGWDSEQA
jgi:phytanoyl-CoA hydroxylase